MPSSITGLRKNFISAAVVNNGNGNHHHPPPSVSTRRTVGSCVALKQTMHLWFLIAACLLMITHQVYQTKRAMHMMTQSEQPVLDFFSLAWQRYNASTGTGNKGDNVTMSQDEDNDDEEDDEDDYHKSQWNDNNIENSKDDKPDGDAYRQQVQEKINVLASKGKMNASAYMDLYERAARQRRQYPKTATLHRTANGTELQPLVRTYEDVKREKINEAWRPPNINTTDYSRMPPLPREDRVLPDMTDGGVIFFLHVPKTAGQTIRQFNWRFVRHMNRQKVRERKKYRRREGPLGSGGDVSNPDEPPSPEVEAFHAQCQEKVNYVTANTLEVFHRQTVSQVNWYLESKNNTKGKVLFIEVHGMDNYHALELEPYIHYWRQRSKQSGVPFFAFTMLREAISLHVSFFNFYYIHPGDPRFCKNPLKPEMKCDVVNNPVAQKLEKFRRRREGRAFYARGNGGRNDAMEQYTLREYMKHRFMDEGQNHANGMQGISHSRLERVMLQVAYNNPQCLFLARGERTFGDEYEAKRLRDFELRRPECQSVYLSLQRTMDWIGRTDRLSNETLPLLTQIMFRMPRLGKHVPKANVSPTSGFVKASHLQPSTLKGLEKLSQFDQELYHRVSEDYTMDQWVNNTDYASV